MSAVVSSGGTLLGIGVDSIELVRIRHALGRRGQKFASRILTEAELAEWERRGRCVSFLAGRWAGKEAVAKALGCGIGGSLSWRDVEILPGSAGQPQVSLRGAALKFFLKQGVGKILISITHSRTLATAAAATTG
jgi:holo-[acyl-carrier protein] synthase